MNVLIVDDSRAMRRILLQITRQLGFQATEAENGADAIEKVKEGPHFELILVDWNMPVMNGLDFVKYMRADEQYSNIKIMMITTETEPTKMARALMAGVDEFVMKPFTPEILQEKFKLLGVSTPTA